VTTMALPISDREFRQIRDFIYEVAGISLTDAKKALVCGRLGKRLRHYGLKKFSDYLRLVSGGAHPEERQMMVDLLTTNETYFFREPRHFDYLREEILPRFRGQPLRVWSAACSTGAEPYSLAMTLAGEHGGDNWHITATDISARVLETARRGLYTLAEASRIPPAYLHKYCLKGVRSQAGQFMIERRLREAIEFRPLNLNGPWTGLDRFHVIFLRNVMIYFDPPTKARLIERMARQLVPGGYLVVGHSESLNGIQGPLRTMVPSVYRLEPR